VSATMDTVRVMLAYPSQAILASLKNLIEADGRMTVVATACQGKECIRKADLSKPTVLVTDLRFPDMGCGRIIRALSNSRLMLAVLVCSPEAVKGSALLDQALQAGAFDFILIPQEADKISSVGRQILTSIFVASFSKTKQIPQAAAGLSAPSADDGQSHLTAVLFDCGTDGLQHLRWIMPRIRAQSEPAVFIVVRKPAPFVIEFLKEIGPQLHAQTFVSQSGSILTSGQILITDQCDSDIILHRQPTGEVEIRYLPRTEQFYEPGPSTVGLYRTFAETYGESLAVILLGCPSEESARGLLEARRHKSLTLIEETSTRMLQQIVTKFPKESIPDDVVTADQIEKFINAVLVAPKV